MKHEIAEATQPEQRKLRGLEASTRDSFERLLETGSAAAKKLEPETKASFARVELNVLDPVERELIRKESGWSDDVVRNINSMEEYEIYQKAGLQEQQAEGRFCLQRNDIDWDRKDAMGRTNRERIEQGLAPLSPSDKTGKKTIELHHIGQHPDSPLAELTWEEHRGKENYLILHTKGGESEIDRPIFDGERREYWKARAEEGEYLS